MEGSDTMDESVMVAATGFTFTAADGRRMTVRRGDTIRAGHPAFKDKAHLLKPQTIRHDHVRDEEQARARVQERPTVDAVLAEVGDDQAKAQAALAAEQRSEQPRKTLIQKLAAADKPGE